MSLLNSMTGSNSEKSRHPQDYYRTPPDTTRALLRVETFPHVIHEPACGDGAMSEVLKESGYCPLSTDLIDRGYGTAGIDFLKTDIRPCDSLITNPPFKLADEFALHAFKLGYRHIALLCRLAWLEGSRRHKTLWADHPPSRIWVFSPRQTLWRGDEESPGKGGTLAFAWFVWSDRHAGTQMGWLTDLQKS